MHTFTLKLNDEEKADLIALSKEDENLDMTAKRVFVHGIDHLTYQRANNKKQYEIKKTGARIYKQAQKDPELAVRFGLSTRG
jgi:hypothetical protein